MSTQQSLFDQSPLNTPIARRSDPATSHAAAKEITESGARGRQHQEVLELVKAHPKLTSRELAVFSQLDRYILARRLPELEAAGLVRKGEARECGVSGFKAVTWEAI